MISSDYFPQRGQFHEFKDNVTLDVEIFESFKRHYVIERTLNLIITKVQLLQVVKSREIFQIPDVTMCKRQ